MSSWKEEINSSDNPLGEYGGTNWGSGGRNGVMIDPNDYSDHSSDSDDDKKRLLPTQPDVLVIGKDDPETGKAHYNYNDSDSDTSDGGYPGESWSARKMRKFKASLTKENLILLGYVIGVILIGTGNRVTFKLMQYATINYGYFISQFTTFVYVPVNFSVIAFKLLFTNDISREQREFPWYKFLIMGTLDSMQGLLIVVGGLYVPGIMQNLLLQGAVPVTMIFSIFLLRNRGCDKCIQTKNILQAQDVKYVEQVDVAQCKGDACQCRILIRGIEYGNSASVIKAYAEDEALFGGELDRNPAAPGDVVIQTSATPWSEHFKTFYTIPQYVGAVIILIGLVVSVWPALTGGDGAGPPQWDLIFFLANVPTALSGVYKEIAFKSVDDMDVWWLNGWVALWQFIIGLSYAPLAAVMSDLAVTDIPQNIWRGIQCVFAGKNFILPAPGTTCGSSSSPNATITNTVFQASSMLMMGVMATNTTVSNDPCKPASGCACECASCGPTVQCCDSCDAIYPDVSSLPAWGATLLYMGFNICYNVFLVLVIKHGSAALMYVASTVVLPLGSISFTIHAFLGEHAKKFDKYDGAGLGVVLFGLIVYRFVAMPGQKKKRSMTANLADAGLGNINFTVPETPAETFQIRPRTVRETRSSYYSRLGVRFD